MEPALSDRMIAAFSVDDATVDPFKLSPDNIAFAQQQGSQLLRFSKVIAFDIQDGRIRRTEVRDDLTGRNRFIEAKVVVNAAGAWTGNIAALAGAHIAMRYSKGTLLVTQSRMRQRRIKSSISSKKQDGRPGLKAIGLRSRIGKGPCQGTFCSQRLAAHLYDRQHLENHQGVAELRAFLRERWRGQQLLLWDTPLVQAELLEAMHFGLFCLELEKTDASK
jgi:L-2-hydroxyglutarate oxidase LhgO